MGITELRQLKTRAGVRARRSDFERALLRHTALTPLDFELASTVARHCDASQERILITEKLTTDEQLMECYARHHKTRVIKEEQLGEFIPPEDVTSAQAMIRHAAMPVVGHDRKPAILVGIPRIATDTSGRAECAIHNGERFLPTARHALQTYIAHLFASRLSYAASTRVPEFESSRTWGGRPESRIGIALLILGLFLGAVLFFPSATFLTLLAWAAFTLLVSSGLKVSAFCASLLKSTRNVAQVKETPPLPKVSILVPMFRETEVVHALVARLSELTYPKCLLDVILVLEEEDDLTQKALASIDLPFWMRVVVVPDGQPRTKPRAMNYALDFCEGDIIGIYDAEDAPDPDQITKVARHFQSRGHDVACVQGILDYYNPRQNWLARCFTIEYATWFRVILPGMTRLGLAIPLGGTTLFFRRDILEKLGGWDAHNVTEDADLGFRLARHGYRTEMIDTVTREEANCRPWPWVKQRSRWLKGYMTTYLVHMRAPKMLFQQLGLRKFVGFQAHFLSALSQFLLAPLLWTFWLVLFGLAHPMDAYVSRDVLVAFTTLFLAIELTNVVLHAYSVSGPLHRHLIMRVPTMHLYAMLGSIAALKALYELIAKPFYWDKTTHGLSEGAQDPAISSATSDDAFDLT